MDLIQSGPRNAKIVIVGEAPGATEAATKVPFSGASGELLNRMLSGASLRRDDCFVTNIAHTRPPKNNFAWFLKGEGKKDLILGMLQLKKDLDEIKPNVVLCLGSQALRVVAGKSGIDKWRGSILESALVPGLKVIGTYHPAYIIRVWDYKAVADFDMLRVAKQAEFPDIRRPERELLLDPPAHIREAVVQEMEKAEWLAIDIECWQDDDGSWTLACVGFSDSPKRSMTIPIRNAGDLEIVRRLCGSPARKIFQNGNNFDIPVLEDNGIETANFQWDTMIGHHTIYPEASSGADEMSMLGGRKRSAALARGLAFQTSIYTEEPFYKDDGKLWKETQDLEMFWRYNALDAAVTREIQEVQSKEIDDFGVRHVMDHAMALTKPLMDATRRGILIDRDKRAELQAKYEAELVNFQMVVDIASGGSLNVKSPKQMSSFLYDTLGLPPQYDKKSGNRTASKDAIAALAGKVAHPALRAVLEIRQRRDLIERYLQAKLDDGNIMRCSWDIAGTRTGRLASRRSTSGSGTNLQTIPAELRQMFIARPGMAFVYADYSQAEARLVAYISRCQGLIELFEDPSRDVHTENASRIFGKPLDQISPEERYLAKRVVHACNYGMGALRLMQVVNEDADITGVRLNKRDAQDLIDRYFMLYPEIKENFWREVDTELKYSRTLTSPFGRKRQFFGRWDDKLLRDAYAYKPQSGVGDLTNMAIVAIYRANIPDTHILLNVHDAILTECPREDAQDVADRMRVLMDIPVPIFNAEVHIPTDCEIGLNWGHKSDDNPDGLDKYVASSS